jgi:N-acetylglucosaminyldiphosphoundecaprenol N-acetyl-beta-D-mannosaminyltransferase
MPISDRKQHFLGVDFDALSYDAAIDEVNASTKSDRFAFVVTPNVDHILRLFPLKPDQVGADFQAAYAAAKLCLCDSRVLRILAKFHGIDLPVVTGSDLTVRLMTGHVKPGQKVAIVGGDIDFPQALAIRLPNVRFVQHIPPMGVLNNPDAIDATVDFVARECADYVFFAIGAPQSEIIAHRCLRRGDCRGVALCIGASIEFLLGRKARAPVWMQRLGIEWLFRLVSEPGRLWRRYLVDGPRIFLLAARWRAK